MTKRFENILRRIVRFGLWTVAGLSFLFMLGTMGAVDMGHVELGTGAVRCLVSLGLFGFSFHLVN